MGKPLTPKLRQRIFERDHYTCQYCGRSAPDVVLHIDHVIPVSKGGTNDEDNLVTACLQCNVRKHDSIINEELLARLKDAALNTDTNFQRKQTQERQQRELLAYPAIFNFAPDGIGVIFPDLLGCISGGKSFPEAVYMARDALSQTMVR